jgi:hypothetical protein
MYMTTILVQCNRTRAVDLLSEGVVSLVNGTVVAVLGGGCSSATEEIATATNGSLPLVSLYSLRLNCTIHRRRNIVLQRGALQGMI